MKKIERKKMMNKFKNCLLACILIAGFALFYNVNFSYASTLDQTDAQKKGAEKQYHSSDIAEGGAYYRKEAGGYIANLADGTEIHRYENGNLKSMVFPTSPKKSYVNCQQNDKKRENPHFWTNLYGKTKQYLGVATNNIGLVGSGIITSYDANYVNDCKFKDAAGVTHDYNISNDGVIDDESHASNGCKPLPLKMAELTTCYLCPLIGKVFVASDSMGAISMARFSVTIRKLLAIGLAIYLAMSVLVHISSFVKVDAAKFWQGVFTQAFKVLIAFALLLYPTAIYEYFISPILVTALEYGKALMVSGTSTSIDASKYITDKTQMLSPVVYVELINYMIKIQSGLATSQAIGSTLICTSNSEAMREIHDLMNFQMFFQGVIVYLFSLLLSIAFGFYLVDSIARLGIFFALLPLLITAWPFKLTSSYMTKGINMLLNAVFTFIFMGTMAILVIQLINASFGTNTAEIIEIFNEGTTSKIEKLFDMTGIEFLSLVACAIFGFKYMSTVTDFAGKFSSYQGPPQTAPMIAGRAAAAAQSAVATTAAPVAKYAGEKAGIAGRKTIRGVKNAIGLGGSSGESKELNFNQESSVTPKPVKPQTQPQNSVSAPQQQKTNVEGKSQEKSKGEESKSNPNAGGGEKKQNKDKIIDITSLQKKDNNGKNNENKDPKK